MDYELHASRCRRSLCEIPSRTANGGRLTERARLKEPIKWRGHGNIKGRLSEAGLCDLTPRTASPERIGESSRSSGSDCAAPGRDMAKRTGRCVSLSLRDGVRANSRLDIVTHTASHPRKKEHHSTGLLRTSALHACAPRARAHSVTRQAH